MIQSCEYETLQSFVPDYEVKARIFSTLTTTEERRIQYEHAQQSLLLRLERLGQQEIQWGRCHNVDKRVLHMFQYKPTQLYKAKPSIKIYKQWLDDLRRNLAKNNEPCACPCKRLTCALKIISNSEVLKRVFRNHRLVNRLLSRPRYRQVVLEYKEELRWLVYNGYIVHVDLFHTYMPEMFPKCTPWTYNPDPDNPDFQKCGHRFHTEAILELVLRSNSKTQVLCSHFQKNIF
jgi:hypothetical protein